MKWKRAALLGGAGLAIAVALLCSPASASTSVPPGPLAGYSTWTIQGSPYVLEGDVVVPSGAGLHIDPGVVVEGKDSATLFIHGQLEVAGAVGSEVVMRPAATATSWGGIVLQRSGLAAIGNASIERALFGLSIASNGTVVVADTVFSHIIGDGISVRGTSGGVLLSRVTVYKAATGLRLQDGAANLAASGLNITDAFDCIVVRSASNITIATSVVATCAGDGASVQLAKDVTIQSTAFSDFASDGLSIQSSEHVRVVFNSFNASEPAYGIWLAGSNDSLVHFNFVNMESWPFDHVFRNDPVGIGVLNPSGPNILRNNTVSAYPIGIEVKGASTAQVLEGNVVGGGRGKGIWLAESPEQSLISNQIVGRDVAFSVTTGAVARLRDYRQVLAGNTANGRPIMWAVDFKGQSINAQPLAILGIVDSDNVTVDNGAFDSGSPSLLIENSRDILVRFTTVLAPASYAYATEVRASQRVALQNMSMRAPTACVLFTNGASNRVEGMNTTACTEAVLTTGTERDLVIANLTVVDKGRVSFFEGTNLTLRDSSFQGTYAVGVINRMLTTSNTFPYDPMDVLGAPTDIHLERVDMALVSYGAAFENFTGLTVVDVRVTQASYGLYLANMGGVTVRRSSFQGSSYGLNAQSVVGLTVDNSSFAGGGLAGVQCRDCTNATFADNLFSGNGVGLFLRNGTGGVATRNLFFSNSLHARADTVANVWDNGTIGNLWDDYTGTDGDGDGIGDTPYPVFGGSAVDRYPIARYADGEPPVADAGPDIEAYEDFPVLLTSYRSTDNIGLRAALWTFEDQGTNVTVEGFFTLYYFTTPGTYTVTLTVIDWGWNRASDTVVVRIRDRTAPTAEAGGNRTVDEDTPALFDGSASTDNDPVFPVGALFTWYVYGATLNVTYGRVSSWTFTEPGEYRVELVVADGAGLTDSDTFTVTVRDTTPPVVPPLGEPTAAEDVVFRVYGSGATDNDPLWPAGRTEWFELWCAGALLDRTTASPAVLFVAQPGPCTVFYYVGDAAGNTGSANVSFVVADTTPPDLQAYGERTVEAGMPAPFDTSLALDNDPVFPAGSGATWTMNVSPGIVTLVGLSVNYTFRVPADYRVELQVSDASGNIAQTTFTVHAHDTSGPHVVIEGPIMIEAGSVAAFSANATDASTISGYVWTVTGLSGIRQGAVLHYQFFATGSYDVRVTVGDMLGNSGNATLTVVVVDTTRPTMLVNIAPLPRDGTVELDAVEGLDATFLGTDPSGVALVEWAWGDGTVSTGSAASHNWSAGGNYTVVVSARDTFGNTNTTNFTVHVAEPPAPPPPPPPPATGEVATNTALAGPVVVLLTVAGAVGGALLGFRLGRARGREPKRP